MFAQENPAPSFKAPKRLRHKRANQFCGMKAILRELFNVIEISPMRIKSIAAQIWKASNQVNKDQQFSLTTIQKRLYDVCLVLRTLGILSSLKKQVHLMTPIKPIIRSQKPLYHQSLSVKVKLREESVKLKRLIVYKLHECLNLFKILKKQRTKNQNGPEKRIWIENAFAVRISIENIFLNECSRSWNTNSVLLKNPTKIFSNMDLLLNIL